jgi:3-oxoacyl-[acyl-carrier protein] reductase
MPLDGHHPAFAAASAGIIGLAKSLARELAPHINVNAVAAPTLQRPDHRLPGAASAREHLVRWDRQLSFAERLHDRPVDANDVAATVAFLASPSGAPYTGAVLRPTGGATIS